MPARTRASAPANRVYSSPAAQQQVKFRPRKQKVTNRHSLAILKSSRQQTLTQIDFVNLQSPINYDEDIDIYDEEGNTRMRKRRRTESDDMISASKYHTQTLTQLDFISTTRLEALSNESGSEQLTITDQAPAEVVTAAQSMGPPKTPSRDRVYEVPSSQSPVTPSSIRSRGSLNKRSPLRSRHISIQAPAFSPIKASLHKPPQLKIEDACGCDDDDDNGDGGDNDGQHTRITRTSASNLSAAESFDVAADSFPDVDSTHSYIKEEIQDSDEEGDERDAHYDYPGRETHMEAEELIKSPKKRRYPDAVSKNSRASFRKGQSADVSQCNESQRLSIEEIDSMPPRSDRSDIIISIHPQHVANIVSRNKDHEFRNYRIPNQVSRMWIYETKPACSLRYMASISSAKNPGEINDLGGLGNEAFNASNAKGRYAYEILQVYELANPVPFTILKANAWLTGPPQKYVYVRPAVVDQLMANLKYPLFKNLSIATSDPLTLLSSDSQEAENQLLSTAYQFTKGVPSTAEHDPPRPSQATTVGLSSSASLINPYGQPRGQPVIDEEDGQEIMIPDSPSNQALLGTPPTLPYLPIERQHVTSPCTVDVPVLLSVPSSQILTRSQMLPESLMDDCVPPPPLLIEDSDLDLDE